MESLLDSKPYGNTALNLDVNNVLEHMRGKPTPSYHAALEHYRWWICTWTHKENTNTLTEQIHTKLCQTVRHMVFTPQPAKRILKLGSPRVKYVSRALVWTREANSRSCALEAPVQGGCDFIASFGWIWWLAWLGNSISRVKLRVGFSLHSAADIHQNKTRS